MELGAREERQGEGTRGEGRETREGGGLRRQRERPARGPRDRRSGVGSDLKRTPRFDDADQIAQMLLVK